MKIGKATPPFYATENSDKGTHLFILKLCYFNPLMWSCAGHSGYIISNHTDFPEL